MIDAMVSDPDVIWLNGIEFKRPGSRTELRAQLGWAGCPKDELDEATRVFWSLLRSEHGTASSC